MISNHVFMWTVIVLSFLAQQFDLTSQNQIYLAGFTISACLVECFTLRHILRTVVLMLNDDGPLGDQADLEHRAQASADQAHTTWPLAPPGAPMPSGFVTGQAPAEAGIGQSQCNTPLQAFAYFGGGLPVGNGNLDYGNGSNGAVLGSSGNEVERWLFRQSSTTGTISSWLLRSVRWLLAECQRQCGHKRVNLAEDPPE